MKGKFLLSFGVIFTLLFLSPTPAFAWTKVGSVYTTDGNYSDVNSAIQDATAGDTVTLPAGTFGFAQGWASSLTIQKRIILQGAGGYTTANTIIESAASPVISINNTNASGIRITGIKFDKTGGTIIRIRGPVINFRIDHCHFNFTSVGGVHIDINYGSFTVPMQGLVDNCRFDYGRFYLLGQSLGTMWDFATWSNPTNLGGENFLYVEDCVGYNWKDGPRPMHFIDGNAAAAWVVRNSKIYGYYFEIHGIQMDNRGARKWEYYRNFIEADKNEVVYRNQYIAWYARSGTGVIFQNEYHGFVQNWMEFYNYRWGGSFGPCGQCNGSSSCDDNDDATGWLCLDQLGAGKDESTRTEVNPTPYQEHQPIYVWGNTINGTNGNIVSTTNSNPWTFNDWFKADRDIFIEGYGNVSMSSGTLTNKPATCTVGQGYWATDQGNWNKATTGDWVGQQGILYKCTAPNTWTEYYTPYTYPHPLRLTDNTICLHKSDTNCDSCISSTELSAFIGLWYINSSDPNMGELMEAIGLWKSEGC